MCTCTIKGIFVIVYCCSVFILQKVMPAISTIYFLCFYYITLFSCIQALYEKPISSDKQTTHLFIPRLNLGVLFTTHSILDNSNTYRYHIFKIDLLKSPPLPTVPLSSVCMNMPQLTQIKVKFSICSLYELLIETYSQQANYLHADIDTNIDTVKHYKHLINII